MFYVSALGTPHQRNRTIENGERASTKVEKRNSFRFFVYVVRTNNGGRKERAEKGKSHVRVLLPVRGAAGDSGSTFSLLYTHLRLEL